MLYNYWGRGISICNSGPCVLQPVSWVICLTVINCSPYKGLMTALYSKVKGWRSLVLLIIHMKNFDKDWRSTHIYLQSNLKFDVFMSEYGDIFLNILIYFFLFYRGISCCVIRPYPLQPSKTLWESDLFTCWSCDNFQPLSPDHVIGIHLFWLRNMINCSLYIPRSSCPFQY